MKRALTNAELGAFKSKLNALQKMNFGTMFVHTVKLKKSTLTPQGPIYEDLFARRLTEKWRNRVKEEGAEGSGER